MSTGDELSLVGKLSESFGVTEPALRLLLSILAGYPIALLHRWFLYGKNPNVQHLYFIVTGFVIGYWNYDVEILHSFAAIIFTYLTLVLFNGSEIGVAITFVFNMSYLLLGYYFVGTDDYDINWTMPQCVLVLRLIGLAYDYYDGQQPPETLSKDNKEVMLKEMPTLLEMFGHMVFPICFLVGPQFNMKRYQNFVAGAYSEPDAPNEPPKSIDYAVRRFTLGVLYLVTFQVLGLFVSDDYILSDDFANISFYKRMFLLGIWGRFTLYKYISCWLLSEGACILIGLTRNGADENGDTKWDGVTNVKLWLFENTTEFNHYIMSFNVNTNHWVAQYIYKRLKFLGNRLLSQAASLLFLAVWHGFHSGYYVCFIFEFIVIYMEKDIKSILGHNEKLSTLLQQPPLSSLVYLMQRLYTFVFMGWCLVPFALLTFERYWKVYAAVNYSGFILFVMWPILYGPVLRFLLVSKREHAD